jgi:hypothetical protein
LDSLTKKFKNIFQKSIDIATFFWYTNQASLADERRGVLISAMDGALAPAMKPQIAYLSCPGRKWELRWSVSGTIGQPGGTVCRHRYAWHISPVFFIPTNDTPGSTVTTFGF